MIDKKHATVTQYYVLCSSKLLCRQNSERSENLIMLVNAIVIYLSWCGVMDSK